MSRKYQISDLTKILDSEINKLKSNEKKVIFARFGISGKISSLAAIGRDLSLSRERVRQIQSEALKKLSFGIVRDYNDFSDYILEKIEKSGGIVKKEKAVYKIFENIDEDDTNEKYLDMFLKIIPGIEEVEKNENFHDSWILSKLPKEELAKVLKDWSNYLRSKKVPTKIEVLLSEHPNHNKHNTTILMALPEVSRELVKTYEGDIGLTEWPEICPKTIRDKIYYVLKRYQKPLHFEEIARTIRNEKFDNKKVVAATVHNELIADERYVLIGRGIYALKEWGYIPGTVKEVIMEVLKRSHKSMSFANIYQLVSKQRVVKKNTILINLQTQKEFKKTKNGNYVIA